jgi:hypothetical protein
MRFWAGSPGYRPKTAKNNSPSPRFLGESRSTPSERGWGMGGVRPLPILSLSSTNKNCVLNFHILWRTEVTVILR